MAEDAELFFYRPAGDVLAGWDGGEVVGGEVVGDEGGWFGFLGHRALLLERR